MPRIRLIKSAIDALLPPNSDVVYWDASCPGFGVKVTPKGNNQTGVARFSPKKRTMGRDLGVSALCHERTWQNYSITSSARASSAGGSVRANAFAVFRLIRSSNLVA